MNVYILRHGETDWNVKKLIQGSSDIELNKNGVELAEITSRGIADDGICFQRIYSSPYKRALKTAEIINARQGAAIITDNRIAEICFGMYEGKCLKELIKTDKNVYYCFTKPSLYVPDDTAESFEHFFDRIRDFINNELKKISCMPGMDNVLVVCHGAVIRAFTAISRELDIDEFWDSTYQPNCSLNLFSLAEGRFEFRWERKVYY